MNASVADRICEMRPPKAKLTEQFSKLFKNQRAVHSRGLASSATHHNNESIPSPVTPSPRWLSDTKQRIGKCITFGMAPDLVEQAGQILYGISQEWRDLVAGSDGYLTDPRRAGLHRHGIVWGEQDSMGHVNNVMYVRYAESGRTNWARNIGQYFDIPNRALWAEMLSSKNIGLILKSITVDFKFPMTWPDRISVYHKLRNKPDESTQSLLLDVLILSEGKQRAAAKCLEDVVVYDYRKSRKTALPPFMLEQFKQIWDLQEDAKEKNVARIQAIESQVRYLEQQTWDRPDAQEDFGSAT